MSASPGLSRLVSARMEAEAQAALEAENAPDVEADDEAPVNPAEPAPPPGVDAGAPATAPVASNQVNNQANKRNKQILLGGLLLLAAVGLAVGLGVGLSGDNEDSSRSNSASGPLGAPGPNGSPDNSPTDLTFFPTASTSPMETPSSLSPTATPVPTSGPTVTASPTSTPFPTPGPSLGPTTSPTATPFPTPGPSASLQPTVTSSTVPTTSQHPTPTPTSTPQPTATPTRAEPSTGPSPAPSITYSPTNFPTITPQPSFQGDWQQLGQDIDGDKAFDRAGISVALSKDGQVLAVSAPFHDGILGNTSAVGQVRVYRYNGTEWIQQGNDIYGEAAGDQSGYSIDLNANGTVLAVGAFRNDHNVTFNNYTVDDQTFSNITQFNQAGQVRVHRFANNIWKQVGQDLDGSAGRDWAGFSVSINDEGKVLAVGAPGNSDAGLEAGQVRVFELEEEEDEEETWIQRGDDIYGEAAGDNAGWSVSLSDDGLTLAASSRLSEGSNNVTDVGHVRVFSFERNEWRQRGQSVEGIVAGEKFGEAAVLSGDGNVIAVGADNPKNNTGVVRLYSYSSQNSNWTQLGKDVIGDALGDEFGQSVALSTDGQTLAVGAWQFDLEAPGYVRVLRLGEGGRWKALGQDLVGERTNDQFGYSVALSSDGLTLAVGATDNADGGFKAGHVRVFELAGGSEPLFCTQEAKECPDGSFVSRNPSENCAFDPCCCLPEETPTCLIGIAACCLDGGWSCPNGETNIYPCSGGDTTGPFSKECSATEGGGS